MKPVKAAFTILFFVFLGPAVKAEIIDGPANFRDSPNGKVLVSLNEGVEVECGDLKNGWFEVSFSMLINNEQYSGGYEPKKGTKLYDMNHRLIGVTMSDIPSQLSIPSATGGLPGHYKFCWIEIRGYVYKSNIRQSSIPENILDSAFRSGKFGFTLDSLKHFMQDEKYRAQGIIKRTLPNCEEYCIYESTVIDPSPGYRIGFVFEKNELLAIEHSRPVNLGNYKSYPTADHNQLYIFRTPKGMTIKTFIDKINLSRSGAD